MVNPSTCNPTFDDGDAVRSKVAYNTGAGDTQPYVQHDPNLPRVYDADKADRLSKHTYQEIKVCTHRHVRFILRSVPLPSPLC